MLSLRSSILVSRITGVVGKVVEYQPSSSTLATLNLINTIHCSGSLSRLYTTSSSSQNRIKYRKKIIPQTSIQDDKENKYKKLVIPYDESHPRSFGLNNQKSYSDDYGDDTNGYDDDDEEINYNQLTFTTDYKDLILKEDDYKIVEDTPLLNITQDQFVQYLNSEYILNGINKIDHVKLESDVKSKSRFRNPTIMLRLNRWAHHKGCNNFRIYAYIMKYLRCIDKTYMALSVYNRLSERFPALSLDCCVESMILNNSIPGNEKEVIGLFERLHKQQKPKNVAVYKEVIKANIYNINKVNYYKDLMESELIAPDFEFHALYIKSLMTHQQYLTDLKTRGGELVLREVKKGNKTRGLGALANMIEKREMDEQIETPDQEMKMERFEMAINYFNSLKSKMSPLIFDSLLNGCWNFERVDLFEKYWEIMQEINLSPLPQTISKAIIKYNNHYGPQKALDFYKKAVGNNLVLSINRDIIHSIFNVLMPFVGTEQDYNQVAEFLDVLEKKQFASLELYENIIGIFNTSHRFIMPGIKDMNKRINRYVESNPDKNVSHLRCLMIKTLLKTKNTKIAIDWMHKLSPKEIPPEIYADIIAYLLKHQCKEELLVIIQEIGTNNNEMLRHNHRILSSLIVFCELEKHPYLEEYKKQLKLMKRVNPLLFKHCTDNIIQTYLLCGHYKEALDRFITRYTKDGRRRVRHKPSPILVANFVSYLQVRGEFIEADKWKARYEMPPASILSKIHNLYRFSHRDSITNRQDINSNNQNDKSQIENQENNNNNNNIDGNNDNAMTDLENQVSELELVEYLNEHPDEIYSRIQNKKEKGKY